MIKKKGSKEKASVKKLRQGESINEIHRFDAISKKPPSNLSKKEALIWSNFLSQIGDNSEMFLSLDESFLERYCILKNNLNELLIFLKEKGHSVEQKKFSKFGISKEIKERPESRVARNLASLVNKMEESLGMTPLARIKLNMDAEKSQDLLSSFLERKNKKQI